jgi:hypothetical protein
VEKEGGSDGELSGEARRPSGRCAAAAGAPLHRLAVAMGPQVELWLGFFGWRWWRAPVTPPAIKAWGRSGPGGGR